MMSKILRMVLVIAPAVALAQPAPKLLVATGKHVAQVVNPGTLICVGGQPTGAAFPPCSPSTKRILYWNMVHEGTWQDVTGSAAAMMRGKATTITHCSFDENYFGHCWGTTELGIPELGGKWEGSWSGVLDYGGSGFTISADIYGNGGQLEGLRARIDEVGLSVGQPGTFILRVQAK